MKGEHLFDSMVSSTDCGLSLLLEPPTSQKRLPDWAQTPSPGPLTLTFLALFGNGSFVNALQNTTISPNHTAADVCQQLYPPFLDSTAGLCTANSSFDMISAWIQELREPESTLQIFDIYALTALLQQAVRQVHDWSGHWTNEPGYGQGAGRLLLYSPGHTTQKLVVTPGAIAAISTLIFLQIVGLLSLLIYIRIHPTWTSRLDAGTMFQLGRSFDSQRESRSSTAEVPTSELARSDGLIGLPERELYAGAVRSPTLGGPHPLSGRH